MNFRVLPMDIAAGAALAACNYQLWRAIKLRKIFAIGVGVTSVSPDNPIAFWVSVVTFAFFWLVTAVLLLLSIPAFFAHT